jgi:hypothetical protein
MPHSSADLHRFLRDQLHGLVLAATVQRAGVYRPSASEAVRNDFRIGLRSTLDALTKDYSRRVSETVHIQHIASLADGLSRRHGRALAKGRFRIGPAQKALNLYLKYLWSAGWIPMPPHCPFDAVIIGVLPYKERISWTKLDSLDGYRTLVKAARLVAGPVPLAEWELRTYQENSSAAQRERLTI